MAARTTIELEFEFRGKRFRDASKGLEAFGLELNKSAARLPEVLRRELERYLRAVRTALIQRHSTPFVNPTHVPATGKADLLRRRGGIRGIRIRAKGGKVLDAVVGSLTIPFPISVHERGATITPRRAQFLTIPLSAALDGRGVPLRPNARAWDNTFVQQSRRGNLLIFQRRGTQIVPLYLLRRSVQLPPRLKAEETLNAGRSFFIDTTIDAMARSFTV